MSDDEKTKILWWFAALFVGSIGANQGINKLTPDVRHDAWTATQDDHELKAVWRRFNRNERYIDDIRDDARLSLANDAVCRAGLQALTKRVEQHWGKQH